MLRLPRWRSTLRPSTRNGSEHALPALDYTAGLHPPTLATLKLVDQSKWITSCVAAKRDALLAVSSAAHDKNIYIAYNNYGNNGSRLQITGAFACPGAVYDLDWHHEHLLAAGASSSLYLLQTREDRLKDTATGLDGLDCVAVFTYASDDQVDVASRIMKCSCAPHTDKIEFASLMSSSSSILIWNAMQTTAPVSILRDLTDYNVSQPSCLRWSQHNDTIRSCIALGTSSGDLGVLDTRLNSHNALVWARSKAHSEEMTSVEWNPFVPYWLASAGHDAAVKVWDLRFNVREVISIEPGHSHAISTIAWSQSHIDILATGSLDRSCSIIHINDQQSLNSVIAETTLTSSAGGFASLVSSPILSGHYNQIMFYGVSSFGELQVIELPIATVEAIHFRNTEKSISIYNQKNPKAASKDSTHIGKTYYPPSIGIEHWSIFDRTPTASLSSFFSTHDAPINELMYNQAIRLFWKELSNVVKGLPLTHDESLSQQKTIKNALQYSWDEELANQSAATLVSPNEARNELLQILRTKEPTVAKSMIPAVLKTLQVSPNAFRVNELKNFMLFLFKHFYIEGLRFGVDVAEIYFSRAYNFVLLHDLIHWLLFPTAYDLDDKIDKERRHAITSAATGQQIISMKDSRLDLMSDLSINPSSKAMETIEVAKEKYTSLKKRVRTAHENVLVDSAIILPMLRLEIRIQETILENSAVLPDKIIQMCRYQRTISVTTNRTYLYCLMQRTEYEELLYVATELVNTYMTYDFGIQLARMLKEQVLPKMTRELLRAANDAKNQPEFEYVAADRSLRIPEPFRDWVLMLGRINKLCPGLSRGPLKELLMQELGIMAGYVFETISLLKNINAHATSKEIYRLTHEMNMLPRYIPSALAKKTGATVPPPDYVSFLRKLQETAGYGVSG